MGPVALFLSACTMVGAPAPVSAPAGAPTTAEAAAEAVTPAGVGRSVSVSPVRPFDEVRGLWVVRSSMTSEAEVRDMVENAGAAGFNTLIVQVRGRADAFYRSGIEPRAETLEGAPDFDPLALAVELGHQRGMAVHAWVNTHLVWGSGALPRSPQHLVNANPEWLAVPELLGRELYSVDAADPEFVSALIRYARERPGLVEGVYSSPSHPAVQDRVYGVWMDLVGRYDLDGIHFDYIRFPSDEFDYSRGALTRFRSWVSAGLPRERLRRLDQAVAADPYALVEALPDEWADFRRAQIDQLVERIYYEVKARRPELVVSAAVVANAEEAYQYRFQNWREWLEDGILDVAVPMAYTSDDGRFRDLVQVARSAVGSRDRVWAGIGAYLNTMGGTLDKIDLAREEDVGGVILFSYDWAIDEGQGDGPAPFLERIGRARFGPR